MTKLELLNPHANSEEKAEQTVSIRPDSLENFTGQAAVRQQLQIAIKAAKFRKESLDHVLFHGPPGLGKTTLSQIISKELGVGFRTTSGPVIAKAGDLAAILTSLQPHDVLFVDEIHRLPIAVEEILYPAIEDFKIDIMIGEGPAARAIRLDLPPFTLVGATTRSGLLSQPLRERFGLPLRLNFYTPEELKSIIIRSAHILNTPIEEAGAAEIARRSRGTARIANRLLRRVRDYLPLKKEATITAELASYALDTLQIDKYGLDHQDIRYLRLIAEQFKGGPVGIETIAAALAEQRDTIEDVVEPYLIQQGYIQRTPRGRALTSKGIEHASPLFKKL